MSEYKVDWYENIKSEKLHIENEEGKNVKSCPSFTEIYKEGFVIPSLATTRLELLQKICCSGKQLEVLVK